MLQGNSCLYVNEFVHCTPYAWLVLLHWTVPSHWPETDHIFDPTDHAAGCWHLEMHTVYRGDHDRMYIEYKCLNWIR